jgi:hypothetical protein
MIVWTQLATYDGEQNCNTSRLQCPTLFASMLNKAAFDEPLLTQARSIATCL